MTATGYIVTVDKDGSNLPATMCWSAVRDARVSEAYWGRMQDKGFRNARLWEYPSMKEITRPKAAKAVESNASAVSDTELRKLVVEWKQEWDRSGSTPQEDESQDWALYNAAAKIEIEDKPEDPRIKVVEKYLLDTFGDDVEEDAYLMAGHIIAKLDEAAK